MEQYINQIICGDNVDVIRRMPSNSVDLTVTSPPYDDLRTYNGFEWDFESLAKELYRVTKDGGIVVWVVGDQTKDFTESLNSFKQAIFFKDMCGFNVLDTMIYQKANYPPAYPTLRRYAQTFEYMFVLSKGRPKTFNPIKVRKSDNTPTVSKSTYRARDGSLQKKVVNNKNKYKQATNVWTFAVGKGNSTNDDKAFAHPAIFPEKLAENHILTWSNPGDIVLDPFIGSGTTAKMAVLNDRKYVGIDISEEYCNIADNRIKEAITDGACKRQMAR